MDNLSGALVEALVLELVDNGSLTQEGLKKVLSRVEDTTGADDPFPRLSEELGKLQSDRSPRF